MTLEEYIIESFADEHGIDLSADPMAMKRIRDAAQRARIELERSAETEINLPFITATPNGPLHINITICQDWEMESIFPARVGTAAKPAATANAKASSTPTAARKPATWSKGPLKKDTPLAGNFMLIAAFLVLAAAIIAYFLFRG